MSGKPAAKRPAPQYVVTGIHPVYGHKPGEKFMAHLPVEQEAALIAGGAIARVPKDTARTVDVDWQSRVTLPPVDMEDEDA